MRGQYDAHERSRDAARHSEKCNRQPVREGMSEMSVIFCLGNHRKNMNNCASHFRMGLVHLDPASSGWNLCADNRTVSDFGESAPASDVCVVTRFYFPALCRGDRVSVFRQVAQSVQQTRNFVATESSANDSSARSSASFASGRRDCED
jgi:hypothetical protein